MQSRLPLNNLNTFAAAAMHLSFQAAAETLYVTPSAVSHQIRNLEAILGYKLFERMDKGVRLTSQGERLFADIQQPLRQLHEASRRAVRGCEDNQLALSVAPVFATRWLLPRLRGFYRSHPEINLSVIASVDITNFSSEPFDASIRIGKGEWTDTLALHLFSREIVAVCHPKLLQRNQGSFSAQQIKSQTLITNAYMPGIWNDWFKSAGVSVPQRLQGLQVESSAHVIEAIRSGDSIGLLDQRFISQEIASGQLVLACEHVLRGDDGGYYLTYPQRAEQLPALACFRDWLLAEIEHERIDPDKTD